MPTLLDYAMLAEWIYDPGKLGIPDVFQLLVTHPSYGILYSGTTLVIVIRGSQNSMDWLRNFQADPIDLGVFRSHQGFFRDAKTLLKLIGPEILLHTDGDILLVGHSAGGCVASLVAFLMAHRRSRFRIVVFGSPPFCDERGVRWFQQNSIYTNIVCERDPIPLFRIPPFRRIGGNRYVLREDFLGVSDEESEGMWNFFWGLWRGDLIYHRMTTYIRLMPPIDFIK